MPKTAATTHKEITLRDRLQQLRRMFPKKFHGQLYAHAIDKKTPQPEATLYTYLASEEDTYMVHQTLFHKSEPRTPAWWREWIKTKALRGTGHPSKGTPAERMGIINGAVLPGVRIKTHKYWRVLAVIGWVLHDIHGAARAAMAKRRHKTKSQRRKDGQNNLRRGHRNMQGRAKYPAVLQRRRKRKHTAVRKHKKRARKVHKVVRRKKAARAARRIHS
jgi:hypothetical protein